jgi:hypothetical protein
MPARHAPPSYLGSRAIFFLFLALGIWSLVAPQQVTSEPNANPVDQTCSPNIALTLQTDAQGHPTGQVTVFAQPSTNNTLHSLRFTQADNAFIDVPSYANGQTAPPAFTVTLPAGTTQKTFFLSAKAAGVATTVQLVATDDCGDWPTFVGSGTGAPWPVATPSPGNTATPTNTSTTPPAPTNTPTRTPTATPTPRPVLSESPSSIVAGGTASVS